MPETTPDLTPPARLDVEHLEAGLRANDPAALIELVDTSAPDDLTYAVSGLTDDDRQSLLQLLDAETAADVLELLPESQQIEALDAMAPAAAAAIVNELPSDAQADLVAELDTADALLAELTEAEAAEIRALVEYDDDTAGGLMITEYLAFPASFTVAQVVTGMQEAADQDRDYDVQYVYLVDAGERLVGVARLRDLLLSRPARPVDAVMIANPSAVRTDDELSRLAAFFDDHHYFGAPVLDAEGRLRGVLQASAVEAALGDRAGDDFNKSAGIIGGEELRSMPLRIRCGRRLAWLSLNIVLNIAAASIIAFHQGTLEAVIALAVFLPIISDMSGCSGNQAVAVSMRELALNVTRPGDFLYVWRQEALVGVVNGLALGTLLGVIAWLWQGNPTLGLVVGSALALNTLVAVSIGGTIPLILKGLKLDPALASGPILTTVTDMCGFFLVLTLAAWSLAKLVA